MAKQTRDTQIVSTKGGKLMQRESIDDAVHLGTMIVAENTLFKVVKKYNDFVWRLKSENGEIVNVFYALSQSWSLHCT